MLVLPCIGVAHLPGDIQIPVADHKDLLRGDGEHHVTVDARVFRTVEQFHAIRPAVCLLRAWHILRLRIADIGIVIRQESAILVLRQRVAVELRRIERHRHRIVLIRECAAVGVRFLDEIIDSLVALVERTDDDGVVRDADIILVVNLTVGDFHEVADLVDVTPHDGTLVTRLHLLVVFGIAEFVIDDFKRATVLVCTCAALVADAGERISGESHGTVACLCHGHGEIDACAMHPACVTKELANLFEQYAVGVFRFRRAVRIGLDEVGPHHLRIQTGTSACRIALQIDIVDGRSCICDGLEDVVLQQLAEEDYRVVIGDGRVAVHGVEHRQGALHGKLVLHQTAVGRIVIMIHRRLYVALPLHRRAGLQLHGDGEGIRGDHRQPHRTVATAAAEVAECTALGAHRFEEIGVSVFFRHERIHGTVEHRPASVYLQHVGGILKRLKWNLVAHILFFFLNTDYKDFMDFPRRRLPLLS